MTQTKIPTTIITGFLGSGKTTLVRHIMRTVGDNKRLALIVNEFGDVGVDGDTLKACGVPNCPEDDIIELANGCICCTVADDFLPAMQKLLSLSPKPDHIIIETSGLALPQPLVKAFRWPDIRSQTSVDSVITLVDGQALAEGLYVTDRAALEAQREADEALDHESPIEELFEDQIIAADLVLITKTDMISLDDLSKVETIVRKEARPGTGIIAIAQGKVPTDVLLGLNHGVEDIIAERPTHHEREGFEDHDHDDFTSFAVEFGEFENAEHCEARLTSIITNHAILRVKGFVAIKNKAMKLAIQAVGPRIDHWFDTAWDEHQPRKSHLVIIGEKGLDQKTITQQLCDG